MLSALVTNGTIIERLNFIRQSEDRRANKKVTQEQQQRVRKVRLRGETVAREVILYSDLRVVKVEGGGVLVGRYAQGSLSTWGKSNITKSIGCL